MLRQCVILVLCIGGSCVSAFQSSFSLTPRHAEAARCIAGMRKSAVGGGFSLLSRHTSRGGTSAAVACASGNAEGGVNLEKFLKTPGIRTPPPAPPGRFKPSHLARGLNGRRETHSSKEDLAARDGVLGCV